MPLAERFQRLHRRVAQTQVLEQEEEGHDGKGGEVAPTAAAGKKENLDQTDNFDARVKYHQRRALRDAYFDASISGAVEEADAKKIYDDKIAKTKPEQEVHARHILVSTEDVEAFIPLTVVLAETDPGSGSYAGIIRVRSGTPMSMVTDAVASAGRRIEMFKEAVPYFLVLILVLLAITYIPVLTLWLPNLVYPS